MTTPTTTTVFTLGGAFSGNHNYLPTMLQGAITNGNNIVQVPYNNFGLFLNTVQAGCEMLNNYLLAGTAPMVMFGHSLGAVVGSYWLSNYGPSTTISPEDLSFVFIGNSVSAYGGALGAEPNAETPNWFGPNVAAPVTTPFTVADIKRQYDGWTDWPTGTMNFNAEYNAKSGQNSVHNKYQNVNPNPTAPGNVYYVIGNQTYIWSLTTPIPELGTTWTHSVASQDAKRRPAIEEAYNRPVIMPSPIY